MSLNDTFGKSARSLVSPGRRPAAPSTTPQATPREPQAPAPEAAPAPAREPESTAPQRTATEPEQPSTSGSATPAPEPGATAGGTDAYSAGAEATSGSIIYVSPTLRDTLDGLRKRQRCTNADLVFDAVDRTQQQLADMVARQHRQDRPANSLFAGRASRTRQRAATPGDRTVPFTFRATAAELAVIDEQVERTGASSRSVLLAVALEAAYGRGQRRRR